ncbi:SMP-30/gluconolactonase/LRE family protein [Cupriavidus sp. CV2]|uniref:SMP-30/gluconolactonase/LRE family protein n=1 Tax=Cupriavidus ulmosensis TaxID=3065913 RepID=UPI00296B3EFE|nr:SMP-30/gluconolactonase/LRE family protein [Cupriavidus sp. CV2]MDW3682018.1 SMP-30/gluconolactonase/LRE family protein [Cupriavidus sp. CV2]
METQNDSQHPEQHELPLQQAASAQRRGFLKGSLALAASTAAGHAVAQWTPSLRYPDPSVVILDPSFAKYRLFNASVEQLATGLRWAEGPVWIGDGGYLLVSDVASNRIMRWDEAGGQLTTFRAPANYPNGNTRDRQGRLITCEGAITRRISRTEHSGKVVTLADNFAGRPFNSPNDIVCKSDGSIWFTDPPFQLSNNYEGRIGKPELPHAAYRIDGETGKLTQVISDLAGPNGLCFSPDEKTLYVIEGRAQPNRLVWAYSVGPDGRLTNRTKHINANGPGALDGIKCDEDGNIWAGWGSGGAPGVNPAPLDGVMVFNPKGKPIGHVRLPERCANLCFGGLENNRLFMASSHSIYALYVNTRGAGAA